MTEVNFYTSEDGTLVGFHIKGHSGYSHEGEDIVCAAISSAVYMTINTVTDVIGIDAEVSAENGDAVLKIPVSDAEMCKTILQGLRLHLLDLERQYSDFIKVKFTEV